MDCLPVLVSTTEAHQCPHSAIGFVSDGTEVRLVMTVPELEGRLASDYVCFRCPLCRRENLNREMDNGSVDKLGCYCLISGGRLRLWKGGNKRARQGSSMAGEGAGGFARGRFSSSHFPRLSRKQKHPTTTRRRCATSAHSHHQAFERKLALWCGSTRKL